MGSGKTHWGKQLSQKLSIPCFDLDEQVTGSEGKSINDIFHDEGEEYFRHKETEILHILTESHDSFILACGGGAPCYFNNIEYMNNAGITVWLNTPVDVLFTRLAKEKENRPLLKGLSDDQLRSYIIKKFSDRRIYYEQARVTVDEEHATCELIIEKIFHA